MGKKSRKTLKNKLLSDSKQSLNPKILDELELLFDIAPPPFLKKSLMEIFFSYLCNTDNENYKREMKDIATDFYCLIQFLETVEIY
jgi:hypothetical protein